MRRSIAAGLLIAASLSMCGLLDVGAAEAADIARIKSVAGTASVVRGKAVTPAVAGALLQASDEITTGADGRFSVKASRAGLYHIMSRYRLPPAPGTTLAKSYTYALTFEATD